MVCFYYIFSRIKELPVLIAGRGEIGAFARSLNDTERADMPLLLSWSSLKALSQMRLDILKYRLLLLSPERVFGMGGAGCWEIP